MRLNDVLLNAKTENSVDFNNQLNEFLSNNERGDIEEFKNNYVKNIMENIDSQYDQEIDYDIDYLNELFIDYSQKLINDFPSDDPDFVEKNKDIIIPKIQKLNLSDEEKRKRKANHDKAVEISKKCIEKEATSNFYDILYMKEEKFNNNDPDKENICAQSRGAARIIGLGSNTNFKDLMQKPVEERKNVLFDILTNLKIATSFFAQDLNDEEFLKKAEDYGRYMIIASNIDKNMIDTILSELEISQDDLTEEQMKQYNDWKDKDADYAVDVGNDYQKKLDIMSNPYYTELSDEDIIKTTYAMQKLLGDFSISQTIGETHLTETSQTYTNGNFSPLLHLNSATYFGSNIFKSQLELDLGQKEKAKEIISKELTTKFNVINESKFMNKLTENKFYDYENKKYVSKEEMISGITEGKKFAIVDDTSEQLTPSIIGEIEAKSNNNNIVINIPPATKINSYKVPEFKKSVLDNLKKANAWTIFTTKEFDNLTTTLNKMMKATTESEFNALAPEAAKWAKAYLDNKNFSSKKKTPKTYQRINFAKEIYESFRAKSQIAEFENDNFNKLKEKDQKILDQHKNKDFKVYSKEIEQICNKLTNKEDLDQKVNLMENVSTYLKVHKLHVQGDPKVFTNNEIANEEKEVFKIEQKLKELGLSQKIEQANRMPIENIQKADEKINEENVEKGQDIKLNDKLKEHFEKEDVKVEKQEEHKNTELTNNLDAQKSK